MRKISISCETGVNHKKIGLAVYEYEGEKEQKKVVRTVEKSLLEKFPRTQITHQKAVRDLLGE
jgi:hypothetical protein